MILRFNEDTGQPEYEGNPREIWEYMHFNGKPVAEPATPAPQKDSRPIGRLPSWMQVANYIAGRGNADMTHTFPDITLHFVGKVIDSRKEILFYNQMFARLAKAQKYLENRTGRKFERERSGLDPNNPKARIMVYRLGKPEQVRHVTGHLTIAEDRLNQIDRVLGPIHEEESQGVALTK
jgi:hypothetical protein